MLSDQFSVSESLYRGVIPSFWDEEENRPSSAAFKDSFGCSVDRDGERSESDCIEFLNSNGTFKAVAKVTVQHTIDVSAHCVYKPFEANQYHSEIHSSPNKVKLTGGQASKLRDKGTVVHQN